jgi:hypothetical protein
VFRNPPGDSAGRLIDELGLKGLQMGGATVSEKHANFIVNDRRGPAADVRRLGDHVRDAVEAAHGIRLEYEIEFLGDWDGWPWPPDEPAATAEDDEPADHAEPASQPDGAPAA